MLPLSERRDPQRCAGFARAAERAFERTGSSVADVAHRELYSCFPSAVRVQQRELGIQDARPLSLTGGMAFAGGPLNHFVFQALVRMADVLRQDPGSTGLLTAVSGMLTKQGVSLWSSEPLAEFAHDDVSEATTRETRAVELTPVAAGRANVATYSVLYDGPVPKRAVLLCDRADGGRMLVPCDDAALALRATQQELCGREVRITADAAVQWL
jgi:acetyl-CoA C-acetyltransferase